MFTHSIYKTFLAKQIALHKTHGKEPKITFRCISVKFARSENVLNKDDLNGIYILRNVLISRTAMRLFYALCA